MGEDPNATVPQPPLLPVGMELEDLEKEVQILLAGVDSFEELQRICAAIALQVITLSVQLWSKLSLLAAI